MFSNCFTRQDFRLVGWTFTKTGRVEPSTRLYSLFSFTQLKNEEGSCVIVSCDYISVKYDRLS